MSQKIFILSLFLQKTQMNLTLTQAMKILWMNAHTVLVIERLGYMTGSRSRFLLPHFSKLILLIDWMKIILSKTFLISAKQKMAQ